MKTLVIGAGAIGCYLAARMTEANAHVTLYGLGASFESIARTGIRLASRNDPDGRSIRVHCSFEQPKPGGWDRVIFAVKAHDLPNAARQFREHVRDSLVLLPQNGLPYWQFLGTGAPVIRLRSVDPDGVAEASIPLDRILGCVVTKGLSARPDGAIFESIVDSDSFSIGSITARQSDEDDMIHELQSAGLPAKRSDNIRLDKWRKLLINAAFNPLGAISHLGFGEVLDVPRGEHLARRLLDETLEVATCFGLPSGIDISGALARAKSSRTHKTSMLQDVEGGRRLEIEPILGALIELADRAALAIPTVRTVYDCLHMINRALVKGPIRQTLNMA
jgi:2-dehydropantoate 2-reductase